MICKRLMLLFEFFLNLNLILVSAWHKSIKFDFKVNDFVTNLDKNQVRLFESVYKSRDFFALLSSNRNNYFDIDQVNPSILIGARNHLYQLRLPDLIPISNQTWPSSQIDSMKCLNRSIINNKDECDNYIKLYLKLDDNIFKICSTNSLNPKCRFYSSSSNSQFDNSIILNETAAIGQAPLKAYENKYVYNYIDKRLFTANAIDLNRFFTSINGLNDQDKITTNMDDNNWLHRADFVNSFKNNGRIFFVFNEETVLDNTVSSVPQRSSHISHICLNDRGAPLNSLRNIWTTYLKSKLSCVFDSNNKLAEFYTDSFQSSSLFYFDEIKSISELFTSSENGKQYFYGLFTTSDKQITASAVCLFSMDQIMDSFNGNYKSKSFTQNDYDSSSSKSQNYVPNPRPSQCPNTLTYQHLIFARKNFIMEKEILSQALIIETSVSDKFMSINVDFEVKSKNNQTKSDIIFIGTETGRILTFVVQEDKMVYSEEIKLFNKESNFLFNYTSEDLSQSVIQNKPIYDRLQQIQSQTNSTAILNLNIYKDQVENNSFLIAITQNKIISLPGEFCSKKIDSKTCNNTIYPYCFWSAQLAKCFSIFSNLDNESNLEVSSLNITTEPLSLVKSFLDEQKTIVSKNDTIPLEILTDIQSYTSYIIKKHDITISINLYFLLFILTLFLFVSLILCIFLFFKIYSKLISKNNNSSIKKPSTDLKSDFYNISKKFAFREKFLEFLKLNKNQKNLKIENPVSYSSSQQSSPFQGSSLVSYSSSSSKSTKSSTFSNLNPNESSADPRYVCLNQNSKNKLCNLNIADLENQIELCKTKFQDYDSSEYYSLKRKRDLKSLTNSQSASLSSSPKSTICSTNNSNNYFTLIKTKLESGVIRDNNANLMTNSNNKYYL